jgi:M6 family metalloprotease-like protein
MKKILTLAFMALILSTSLKAVPAKRTQTTVIQADGTELTVIKRGDEFLHYYTTTDGLILKKGEKNGYYYAIMNDGIFEVTSQLAHNPKARKVKENNFISDINWEQNRADIKAIHKVKASRRYTEMRKTDALTTGNVKVLVLLVEYSDVSFSKEDAVMKTYMDSQLNTPGNTNGGAAGSAKEYFETQSFGKFSPQFDVVGPVRLSNTRAYYGANGSNDNDVRPARMIVDACNKVKSTVDFSDYDSNNDGKVDIVYCIYAGEGEASGGPDESIWPHQWNIVYGGESFSDDGVSVGKYACSNEIMGGQIAGNGTICHEFSHCLGLPDFYDTNYGGNEGMGYWDLMDSGSYLGDGYTPPCWSAHERTFVGWLTPTVVTNALEVSDLQPLNEEGKAYQIINPANSKEYYIIDNRQKRGFDKGLIGHGLMVMHIDYNEYAWSSNGPNNVAGHERCYILCADQQRSFNSYNEIVNDLFPSSLNVTSITPTTNPKMSLYTGGTVELSITNIEENESGLLSFNFVAPLAIPTALPATNQTNTSFTANWSAVEGATSYSIEMKEATAEEEDAVFNETFDDITISLASKDLSSTIDNYMNSEGWSGVKLFGGNKKIRLGSSSTAGYLKSSAFACSNDKVTVAINAKSYSSTDGSTLRIAIYNSDLSSETPMDYKQFTLPAEAGNYCTVLNNTAENVIIKLLTDGESKPRGYIDNLVVMRGDQSSDFEEQGFTKLSSPSVKMAKKEMNSNSLSSMVEMMKNIYNGITTTSHTFTNLESNKSYKYRVKAMNASSESSYSGYVTVVLGSQGIDTVLASSALFVQGNEVRFSLKRATILNIYNISGQCIRTVECTEGENRIQLTKGLYLLKLGNESYKIAITQ